MTYCRKGQFDRASDAFERLLTSSNRAPFFVGWGAIAHALAGRRRETLTLAEDLAARHPSEYVHPVTPVLIGIALGDRHQTEDALRAFIHQNGSGFQIGHVVPFLEEWRFKPGFVELLRRLHLEPESAEGGFPLTDLAAVILIGCSTGSSSADSSSLMVLGCRGTRLIKPRR